MFISAFPSVDKTAVRLHGTLQEKFGRAYAGIAAYALDPENPAEAYVMAHRNADRASHAHIRFTHNALERRQVVLESTTLPRALQNPGEAIMLQSRQVPGHICVNLRPQSDSALILQAALNYDWMKGGERNAAEEIFKSAGDVIHLEKAARAFPETDAARHAKTPATPTHYLVHYDIAGSERIRAESGKVAGNLFKKLADEASSLAERHGGQLFRMEGDGGWLAFPLSLQSAFEAAKEIKDDKIVPFADALAEEYGRIKSRYDGLVPVKNSSLKIHAQPGYLRAISAGGLSDFDGDAFAKIRLADKLRTRRSPAIMIADMPSPFKP